MRRLRLESVPQDDPTPILVTGCYRSGTTLVEKILNMHPSITVASQPFPVLYFLIKERFNSAIGIQRRYPLDHLFMEDAYTREDLDDFLRSYTLDDDALNEFVQRMGNYSAGLWTPAIIQILDGLTPGTFFDVHAQLNRRIARLFPAGDQHYVGSKEVLVEELALPLIGIGAKVVFVIRDPRAMITSLNFRDRDNLTGGLRPVLYSLRVWRKGVALAVAALQGGGAAVIRYEDIVLDAGGTADKLTDFLGVGRFAADAFARGIKDQSGRVWTGNSSFADRTGIYRSSLDVYVQRLPHLVQSFIEAVCEPEMRLMGYRIMGAAHEQALMEYRDPFQSIHERFPPDYSSDSGRVDAERKRLHLLREGLTDPSEQRRWFLAPEAYQSLSAVYP